MPEELTTVQVDKETSEVLGWLANQDRRSKTGEFRWLVDQEKARRVSQPSPLTLEAAQAAAESMENR